MLNIATNDGFGDAGGGNKVAFRPNPVSSPIDLFEKRKLFLQFSGGIGLYQTDNRANTYLGWDGDKEMNVVLVMINLFYAYIGVVLADVEQFPFYVRE